MKFGKREGFLLTILCIALYAFIFVKFIYSGYIPQIEEIQEKIEQKTVEKETLDRDLKNIDTLKNNLNIKTVRNERLEEYLMNDANVSDSIDYIDKLTKFFQKNVSDVSIKAPVEKTVSAKEAQDSKNKDSKDNNNIFYEFQISFNTKMTYDEAMNLVDYVEGGTKKVKIAKFALLPAEKEAAGTANGATNNIVSNNNPNNFKVEMTVSLYALNPGNINKIYEYSRQRFNSYDSNDGIIIVPKSNTTPSNNINVPNVSTNIPTNNNTKVAQAAIPRDIDLSVKSFMAAGPNFYAHGVGGYNNFAKFKTKGTSDVQLNIHETRYDIKIVNSENETYKLEGKLPNRDIHFYVSVGFPTTIVENKNLGANIKIVNNSGKKINIHLDDKSKRARITDRSGSVILLSSEQEKVYIL